MRRKTITVSDINDEKYSYPPWLVTHVSPVIAPSSGRAIKTHISRGTKGIELF